MIALCGTLAQAMIVKATMDWLISEDDSSECYLQAYANGREHGFHIVGRAGRCSFAGNRNSDSIVVYCAKSSREFSAQGNVPSDKAYDNGTYFAPSAEFEAAVFILQYVTGNVY